MSESHKVIRLVSKSTERTISRYGYYDEESDSYKIPAILIAQFGRNFNESSKSISGADLMGITLRQVKTVLSFSSGKTVFLECEKKRILIDFYSDKGFIALDNEVISKDSKELKQMYRLV